jgi:DNase/tRNase domain of colicin-like bacteriocin
VGRLLLDYCREPSTIIGSAMSGSGLSAGVEGELASPAVNYLRNADGSLLSYTELKVLSDGNLYDVQPWVGDMLSASRYSPATSVVLEGWKYATPFGGMLSCVSRYETCGGLGWGLAVVSLIPGGSTAKTAPSAYSVAFRTTIPRGLKPNNGAHFRAANSELQAAIHADAEFAQMASRLNIRIPTNMRYSPDGWTWHHVYDMPGVLELVPRMQHMPGSPWQALLHRGPNGGGGMAQWGSTW